MQEAGTFCLQMKNLKQEAFCSNSTLRRPQNSGSSGSIFTAFTEREEDSNTLLQYISQVEDKSSHSHLHDIQISVPGPTGQVATGSVTRQIRTTRQEFFKRKLELQAKLRHSAMNLRRLVVLKIAQVIQTGLTFTSSLYFLVRPATSFRTTPIGLLERHQRLH